MFYKPRLATSELKLLRLLNARMNLTGREKQHYLNLEKGFEGELKFDLLLDGLTGERLILNDLLLEINNTSFQLDSLMIVQDTIYTFEIKNMEGEFYYENHSFHSISGTEIKNPNHQSQRSKILLRQLLKNINLHFPVEAFVIFVNPHFTLYQAPRELPIILPTQLQSFMTTLASKPSKLNSRHTKLAETLLLEHHNESPYTRRPAYHYRQLKKGITCPKCHAFMLKTENRMLMCGSCSWMENLDSPVMRSIEEFKLLFPDQKITTRVMVDWCGGDYSDKTIRRILVQNLSLKGYGRWTYFE
ncbi:nuclease-related domain-containing protein [Mesobacillus foraminis]|uniref:nuclease-related domain-containing protein n=1 Tax=Mesobacillus foraminis TaxID=279826 RepID=UPI000EF4839E|nr:nuclease-related domain-containing protein [Mesobacillus foraminis]